MDPYSVDDIKRRKDNSFIKTRESEDVFRALSSQLVIPETSYRIQLGHVSGKWASRLLKYSIEIDTYVYKDKELSVSGFPRQISIIGWVLRTVKIPHINLFQVSKPVLALTRELRYKMGNHLPYPSIFKPPEPPDDIGVTTNLQRNRPVEEEVPEVELFCRYCGSTLAMDERFCSVCGKKS